MKFLGYVHKSLTLEIAPVILHTVISHSCGTDYDVYFLPSPVTDVMSTAISVPIKIKQYPSFLVHKKKL
jgi:hypothetical protein